MLAVRLRPTIVPKSRKQKSSYLETFHSSPSNSPQMVSDLNDDTFIMGNDKFGLCQTNDLTETAELGEEDDEEEVAEKGKMEKKLNTTMITTTMRNQRHAMMIVKIQSL